MIATIPDSDTVLQARWERTLRRLPECRECGKPILTDRYVELRAGLYCWDCIMGGLGLTDADFGEEDEPW